MRIYWRKYRSSHRSQNSPERHLTSDKYWEYILLVLNLRTLGTNEQTKRTTQQTAELLAVKKLCRRRKKEEVRCCCLLLRIMPKTLAIQILALLPAVSAFTSPPLVARSFSGVSLPSRRYAAAATDPESGSPHVTPGDKQAKKWAGPFNYMSVVSTDSPTTPASVDAPTSAPSIPKSYMSAAAPMSSSKTKGKDAGALFQGTMSHMQSMNELNRRRMAAKTSAGEVVAAAAGCGALAGSVLGASLYSSAWLAGGAIGAFGAAWCAAKDPGFSGETARRAAALLLRRLAAGAILKEELTIAWNSGRILNQWDKLLSQVEKDWAVQDRWAKFTAGLSDYDSKYRVRDRAKGWGSALNSKAQKWGTKAKDKWDDGTFWSSSLAALPWLNNNDEYDDAYEYGSRGRYGRITNRKRRSSRQYHQQEEPRFWWQRRPREEEEERYYKSNQRRFSSSASKKSRKGRPLPVLGGGPVAAISRTATSLLDGVSSITNGRFDNDYSRRANSRREDSRRDLSWREPSSRVRSSGFVDDSSGGMMVGTAPLYASSSSSSSSLATSPWDAASAGAAAGALTSAVLVLAAEGQFTPLAQATAAAIVDVLSPFAAEYRATTAALAASASMSLLAPASAVAVSTSGSAGSAAAIGGDLSSAELFFSGATTAASAAAVGASSLGSGAAVAAAGPGVGSRSGNAAAPFVEQGAVFIAAAAGAAIHSASALMSSVADNSIGTTPAATTSSISTAASSLDSGSNSGAAAAEAAGWALYAATAATTLD